MTVVKMQWLPDIEKIFLRNKISCLKGRTTNDRREECVDFKCDTDKLNIVMHRYRNNRSQTAKKTETFGKAKISL